jgi:hypothetical protein
MADKHSVRAAMRGIYNDADAGVVDTGERVVHGASRAR